MNKRSNLLTEDI